MTSLALTGSPSHGDTQAADRGVIIVTYDSAGDIPELLQSLRVASSDVTNHVVVVDNASQDESVAVARVPDAVVTRREAGSGSDQLVAPIAVNRVRYYRAHHGRASAGVFTAAVLLHEAVRSGRSAHRASLRAVLRRAAPSDVLQLGSGCA